MARGRTPALAVPEDPLRSAMRGSDVQVARPPGGKGGKHAALQAILDLDCSADLKRTITRMFADPKNAKAISDEEAALREKRYGDERAAQLAQQARLLTEERALMDRELAMFK